MANHHVLSSTVSSLLSSYKMLELHLGARQIEEAGWPTDPRRPAELLSAQIACFRASRKLSRISVEGGS